MFSGAPFKILANAVDAAAFKFDSEKREALRKKLNISKNAVLLGHVGRFMPQKIIRSYWTFLLRWRRWSRMRG